MKTGIIISHNNGLGDVIVLNGCVRYLAEQFDVAYLIVFDNRYKHYEFMYRDNPKIKLCKLVDCWTSSKTLKRQRRAFDIIKKKKTDFKFEERHIYINDMDEWLLKAKILNLPDTTVWPQLFYELMDVPYAARYYNWYLERDRKREKSLEAKLHIPEKYALCIGDTRKYKFNIPFETDLPILNPLANKFWNKTLLFDWMGIIERASEIHTVDTSWLHLIRMMQLDVPKFYYDVRYVAMNGEEYLNDFFETGWQRVIPEYVGKWMKDEYWRT